MLTLVVGGDELDPRAGIPRLPGAVRLCTEYGGASDMY